MSIDTFMSHSRVGVVSQMADGFASGVSAVAGFVSDELTRRRVAHELSALSDRDLADIGVVRDDIPGIAAGTFRR